MERVACGLLSVAAVAVHACSWGSGARRHDGFGVAWSRGRPAFDLLGTLLLVSGLLWWRRRLFLSPSLPSSLPSSLLAFLPPPLYVSVVFLRTHAHTRCVSGIRLQRSASFLTPSTSRRFGRRRCFAARVFQSSLCWQTSVTIERVSCDDLEALCLEWRWPPIRRFKQLPFGCKLRALPESARLTVVVVKVVYCKFITGKSALSLPAAGCVPHTTHLSIPRWEGLRRSRLAHFVILHRPPKRGAYNQPGCTTVLLVFMAVGY